MAYSCDELTKATQEGAKLAFDLVVSHIWTSEKYDGLYMSQLKEIRTLIQTAYEKGYADGKCGRFRE